MQIRIATPEDLPAILGISNLAAEHTTANFAVEPETLEQWRADWNETHAMFPWLVAQADDEGPVIGFAKASPHRGRCAYAWSAEVTVYVNPDHHRQGTGHALYGRLVSILEHQGYHTLTAGIALPNLPSVDLHESFGFERVGVFEGIGWKFDRWHDVGYWQLKFACPEEPPPPVRPVESVLREESAPIDS